MLQLIVLCLNYLPVLLLLSTIAEAEKTTYFNALPTHSIFVLQLSRKYHHSNCRVQCSCSGCYHRQPHGSCRHN